MVLIFLGIAFAIVITIGIVVIRKNFSAIKGGGMAAASVSPSNSKTAQEFLPFIDIEDGIIDLGDFRYRAVVECTSVNYSLKTNEEKDIIEAQFRKFLDSVNYPLSFFVQTKEINYGSIMNSLKTDIGKTLAKYPQFQNYAEAYYAEIEHLKQTINNTKQKKKYVIIPYEDAVSMLELKGNEKKAYSIKEAHSRAQQIVAGLNGMGLKAKELNNAEVIELMYSMYHRDDDSFIEGAGTGEYLTDVVTSAEIPSAANDKLKEAILVLQEAENRFRIQILDDKLSYGASQVFSAMNSGIEDYKQQLIEVEKNGGIDTLKTLEEELNDIKKMSGEQSTSINSTSFRNRFNDKK